MKILPILIIGPALFLSGCKPDEWVRNRNEVVRASAYDNFSGSIEIKTTEKTDQVCQSYKNELNRTGVGVIGALPKVDEFEELGFYYYKSRAFITFTKVGTRDYKLEIFESPDYFRLPRTVPKEDIIIENSNEISIAQLSKILDEVFNNSRNQIYFSHEDLEEIYLRNTDYKSRKILIENLVSQHFTAAQNRFMICVDRSRILDEKFYSWAEYSKLKNGLESAESYFKSIGNRWF